MNPTPLVSIVIPNYNYSRFLEARFRSILEQGCENCEIIFLDDASTDDSVEFVRKNFSEHIDQFVVNEVNTGSPFVQWNRGVRLARGEFVWIAEADDVCAPGFLEKLLKAVSASPRIGLAYCTTVPIDTDGEVLDAGFHHRYMSDLHTERWNHDFTANGREEVQGYLGRKNTITNASGVLFRREAYIQSGYAPENMRMCGDWYAYCRLLENWDVAFVAEPLNYHRQHPSKQTNKSVLNLTYFEEFAAVQDYVARQFGLNATQRQEAFQRFVGEWDRLTATHLGRIDLPGTVALARVCARYYRTPAQRLGALKHMVKNSIKSLGMKWAKR